MNTNTQVPTDAALMKANILGFATQHKFASVPDAHIPTLYKRASRVQEVQMTKRAKIRELVLQVLTPATA